MSAAESFASHRSRRCSWTGSGDRADRARPTRPRARRPARSSAPSRRAIATTRRRAIAAAGRAAAAWAGADRLRPRRAHARGRRRHRGAAATSSPARSRSTRASRWHAEAYDEVDELRRLLARWRPRTPSASAASCPTRSRPASGSCSCAARSASSAVISPWNWPYTMPAELVAPALACGNTVVWTPAPSHRGVRGRAGRAASPRPTCRPASSTSSPAPGPWSATRSPPTPASTPSAFIGSTATGRLVAQARGGQGRAARDGRQRPARRPRRRRRRRGGRGDAHRLLPVRRAELHRGRAHPRAPRPCATSIVEKLARRVTEQVLLGDPFDDGHDDGPGQQRAGRRQDGRARRPTPSTAARRVVAGGERAAASRPTSTGRRRSSPTSRRRARGAPRRPSARSRRVVAIDVPRAGDRADQRLALRPARRRSSPADLTAACSFAERCAPGWVNINESSNYWESHLPFGGRSGTDSGVGRVGGRARHAAVHRAADRGPLAVGAASEDRADLALEGDDVVAGDRPRALGVAVADRGQQVASARGPAPRGAAGGR